MSREGLVVLAYSDFETKATVFPELSEVHVEGEVHELLADLGHREDIESDSHRYWITSIVWPHSSVIINLAIKIEL